MILFGGVDNGGAGLSDTWAWDGISWQQLTTVISPAARYGYFAAPVQGHVVCFGGLTQFPGGAYLGDTWTFDGTEWHPKIDYVTSPINGNRYALTPPMTWTDTEALAVLEGGHLATVRSQAEQNWLVQTFGTDNLWLGYTDEAVEGQWTWSSGESTTYTNWHPAEPNNGGGNGEHYCHFHLLFGSGLWGDAATSVAFPGIVEIPGGPVADVTANLLSTTATPSPLRGHALASLPSGGALLFGGQTASGPFFPTYELQGTDWNKQFPNPQPGVRSAHTLLLDQARQNNVMFGGENPLGAKLGDTWTYANGQWYYLNPINTPSPRSYHAMAYDPTTDMSILFGGEDAFATAIGDMWQWDGTDWFQLTPPTSLPARMRHGMAWDRLRGVLVLFGGTNGTARLDDVWEWNGTDWAQIMPTQPNGFAYGPSARDGFVMAYDPKAERVVVIGGETDSGCVDDAWSWDGSSWLRYLPTSGSALPSARQGAQLYFDASANELRMHGGGCGAEFSAELWQLQLPVFSRYESYGQGCMGSLGMPTLSFDASTSPVIGTTFNLIYDNVPGGALPAFGAYGYSRTSYFGVPLPIDLGVAGLPGCPLLQSADEAPTLTAPNGTGQVIWPVAIPNNAQLLGGELFFQALHLELFGFPTWAAMSNGVAVRIGDQ
jgi:hypothetical protein